MDGIGSFQKASSAYGILDTLDHVQLVGSLGILPKRVKRTENIHWSSLVLFRAGAGLPTKMRADHMAGENDSGDWCNLLDS